MVVIVHFVFDQALSNRTQTGDFRDAARADTNSVFVDISVAVGVAPIAGLIKARAHLCFLVVAVFAVVSVAIGHGAPEYTRAQDPITIPIAVVIPAGPVDGVVVGGAIAIIVQAVTNLVSARVNRCIVVVAVR